MTPEQLNDLRTDVLGNPDTLALYNAGDRAGLADVYNAPASPDYWVWRNQVAREEVEEDDAFNWTVVDNLSTGSKYRIWEWMFGSKGYINPSKANIRAGIAACWVGNAQLLAVQAMVLAKCKRAATRAEKLFATGTGSTGSPAVMGFEGALSIDDIRAAVALG
jgi:hypothetical protein